MNTKRMIYISLCTAVLSIVSPFSIPLPFSPVPFTLSLLAIFVISAILEPKDACIAVVLYMLLGMVGLPIFSGFQGGIQKLVGPTGGYLIGYLAIVFCASFAYRLKGSRIYYIFGMLLGTVICYIFGSIWLSHQAGLTLMQALFMGVIPYIPADVIKLTAAAVVAPELVNRLSYKYSK